MSGVLRRTVTWSVQSATMAGWMRGALIATLVLGASCAARGSGAVEYVATSSGGPATDPAREWRHPVVLVTVDGVRWQEIFEGTDPGRTARPRRAAELVPNLERLARERGAAVGAPGLGLVRASGPEFVSLPGYTEILTGRSVHGCPNNECDGPGVPTLLDQAHDAGARVAAFASWDRLARATSAQPGRFFVSCGRHGDPTIDPAPGGGDFRPDRVTADLALAHLERERPDVLFLGLGEPDEYAHHSDYEGYLRALSFADAVVGRLFATLDRMGPRGARTHVIVTVDHGRSSAFHSHGGFAPESARVWLFAAGPEIAARGRVVSPREHRLADVAPTLRAVMGLPRDLAPPAGEPLDELFASRTLAAYVESPTGQETPVPPSPQ